LKHLDALRERRERLLLVRRPRRRHKQHLIQPPLLAALLRENQVAHVDRVKRAAENAEPHRAKCSRLDSELNGNLQLTIVKFQLSIVNAVGLIYFFAAKSTSVSRRYCAACSGGTGLM